MEISEFLQKANSNATAIELDNRAIARLEGLIELLKRFTQLKRLSLKSNKLKYIPETISALQSLEELDILGNPIESLNDLIISLERLPNLRKLNISISSLEEESFLVIHLPQLEFINKKKIDQEDGQEEKNAENNEIQFELDFEYFNSANIQEAKGAYEDLRDLLIENNFGSMDEMQNEFDIQAHKIIQDTKEKCSQETNPSLQMLVQLKQKYTLFEQCFSKAIEFSEKVDERLFESLATIHDSHALIFKQMSKIIQDQSKKIDDFHHQYDSKYDTSISRFKQLESQIESLQQENKQYLTKIIRLSKGLSPLKDSTNDKLNVKGDQNIQFPSSPTINISSSKNLTLHQLKELIGEIYSSKEWFDTKEQNKQHLPPQTMEMHMYEYLTHKYGLKTIVIEQASNIIHAIRRMTADDNDVAVFTKILKNECDENFRFAQQQLKKTIKELLVMHLKGKYPLKNAGEIKQMVDSRIGGQISLEEGRDIVGYMYNKEDNTVIMEQVNDCVLYSQPSPPKKKGQRRDDSKDALAINVSSNKILYSSFEKIVLDFQLKSHEKFLRPFCNLFKQFDQDIDGVLSEDEFRELINSIGVSISQDEVERYLKILDPFTMQKVTFSQIVNLFSEETIVNNNSAVSILQFLSLSFPQQQQQQQ